MSERVDRVYRQIRELIQKGYGPGHRLPPERALAAMCDVSFTVVRQALDRLRKEGRVTTVPSRGSFVAAARRRGRPRRARAVGLMISGERRSLLQSPFDASIFRGLQRHLKRRGVGLDVLENPTPGPRFTRQTLRPPVERVPWNEINGLLIYGVFDAEVLAHPRLRAGPALVVDQDCTRQGLHSVSFDDRQAGMLCARQLLGLGHTRFAVVEEAVYCERGYDKAWLDRRFGFEETVLEAAGTIRPDWRMAQSRFEDMTGENAQWREPLEKIIALSPDERPTAIFTPAVAIMSDMQSFLHERNLGVPQDFSLITVCAAFQGPPPKPWTAEVPPTVVVCDPAALGARAGEVILDLIAGGADALATPRLHPVAVSLHKGRTTARPTL